jgi:hypothetical protein
MYLVNVFCFPTTSRPEVPTVSLGVAIPSHVLQELNNLPVSSLRKIEHRVRTRPPRVVDGFLEVYLVSLCCFEVLKNKNLMPKIVALRDSFSMFLAHPANEYLSIEKREWTWQEPQLFECHRTTGGEIRPCPRLYSTMLLG